MTNSTPTATQTKTYLVEGTFRQTDGTTVGFSETVEAIGYNEATELARPNFPAGKVDFMMTIQVSA